MATATSGSPGPVHRHLRAPGRTAAGERTRGGKQQGVTQHCHQVLRPRARSKKLWDCSILSLCVTEPAMLPAESGSHLHSFVLSRNVKDHGDKASYDNSHHILADPSPRAQSKEIAPHGHIPVN